MSEQKDEPDRAWALLQYDSSGSGLLRLNNVRGATIKGGTFSATYHAAYLATEDDLPGLVFRPTSPTNGV